MQFQLEKIAKTGAKLPRRQCKNCEYWVGDKAIKCHRCMVLLPLKPEFEGIKMKAYKLINPPKCNVIA